MQNFILYQLKNYLGQVQGPILAEKVRRFRRLNFRKLSYSDIQKEISNVLCFGDSATLMPMLGTYPAKTRFYRVRKLGTDDRSFPLQGMRIDADAWNPPPAVAGIQRLNKAGESLLYTTPMNCNAAIEEMRLEEDEIFSLIVYQAQFPIKVAQIGVSYFPSDLTDEEKYKLEILNDFLEHEFTREVGRGTEHLYQISEIIAKDYYDLPPEMQDAWCYPSVAERGQVNVCFRPEQAREKLELLGVQFCRHKRKMDTFQIEVLAVASGFGPDGMFQYHNIGSNVQKAIFPEIGTLR